MLFVLFFIPPLSLSPSLCQIVQYLSVWVLCRILVHASTGVQKEQFAIRDELSYDPDSPSLLTNLQSSNWYVVEAVYRCRGRPGRWMDCASSTTYACQAKCESSVLIKLEALFVDVAVDKCKNLLHVGNWKYVTSWEQWNCLWSISTFVSLPTLWLNIPVIIFTLFTWLSLCGAVGS